MAKSDILKGGRQAFRDQDWQKSYAMLIAADKKAGLEPGDLELAARTAYLTGKEDEYKAFWTRAHQGYLDDNNIPRAVNCAFWLGLILLSRGDKAQGSGWISRARRLLHDFGGECVEMGYIRIPQALQYLQDGDPAAAHKLFGSAVTLGTRFKDADLLSMGQLGCGQALIRMCKTTEGTALLDESMIAVVAGETSPIVTGIIYCAVIETCHKIFDLRRAHEWTDALCQWCEAHPDLFPYRGQCLVRRAELLQLHGDWLGAESEIKKACVHFSRPPQELAAGEAFYRYGEICRLKGNYAEALELYRQASKRGFKPQPGLALLRLAHRELDVARAAIDQTEKEKKDPVSRSKILPVYIEIMIETGELQAAQKAAEELGEIAAVFSASFLDAVAARARGYILLFSGKPAAAIVQLRTALTAFTNAEAMYESAKTCALIGFACWKLRDDDTAKMEFEAAREIFERLGAVPDLKILDTVLPKKNPGGLTAREMEVLKQLSTGKTNKEIAADLFLSERTVDRHVGNILTKIDVPSRTAAATYAHKNHLL
jgi:DNA-binding NarL/FixJ family response regulator